MKTQIEILTIDQAFKLRRITAQEKTDHHSYKKGFVSPVDEKHFVYVNGHFAAISEKKITTKEAKEIEAVKEMIDYLK